MDSNHNSDKFLLKTMTIKNYPSFDNLNLEFSLGFNVLIGDNGTGISSILN